MMTSGLCDAAANTLERLQSVNVRMFWRFQGDKTYYVHSDETHNFAPSVPVNNRHWNNGNILRGRMVWEHMHTKMYMYVLFVKLMTFRITLEFVDPKMWPGIQMRWPWERWWDPMSVIFFILY